MPRLINLELLPASAVAKIESFIHQLLDLQSENIQGIVVFGSVAGPNYDPKVSDINSAVIVKELSISMLSKNLNILADSKSKRFARPLFLTKEYILSSLDVFPIEFSEIKDNHILLYGEDVFNDIIIDPKNIRLFCEEQVKGKILLIYQSYIDSGGDERLLRKILHDSLNGLLPIFRQLLMIRNILPKTHKRELLEQFCQSFALNPDHIIPLYDDRYGSSVIAVSFVSKYLQDYLHLLTQLSDRIDSL